MKRHQLTILLVLAVMSVMAMPAVFDFVAPIHAQTSGPFPDMDKNGKPLIPRPNPFIWYSPNDLAHNAVTLPASAATTNTNIVTTSGATALTYYVNCTQSVKVTINTYTADDIANPQALNPAPGKAFTLFASYDLFTAVAAAPHQIYIATELAPNATSGTVAITVRLPQAAVSFSETNAGATPGTCTGRLAVKYN